MRSNEADRERYHAARQGGLCTKCGSRAVDRAGHMHDGLRCWTCWTCLLKQRERDRARYWWRIENGICTACGQAPAGETTRCEPCREKSNLAGRLKRQMHAMQRGRGQGREW